MTTFFRLLDAPVEEKANTLCEAICHLTRVRGQSRRVFEFDPAMLSVVPGSPFAYWLPEKLRRAFAELPPFETGERVAKHGGVTLDDGRFLRLWTEVPESVLGRAFVPFAKGGPARRFYADLPVCVRWENDGVEIKAHVSSVRERNGWGDQWTAVLNGYSYYLRPGLTWPLRASRFCPQALPAGCVFSARGYCVFAPPQELLPTLAFCSSSAFDYLFKVRLGRFAHPEFVVGVIEDIPTPHFHDDLAGALGKTARRGWSIQRQLDAVDETSRGFVLPSALLWPTAGLAGHRTADVLLNDIQIEIDRMVFHMYGFGEAEAQHVTDFLRHGAQDEAIEVEGTGEEEVPRASHGEDVRSWLVGVAFGRFDKRLATGERAIPPEPEPFDPLPSRSPGMWPEGEPRDVIPPAILVDDPGHDHDLAARVTNAAANTGWPIPDDLRQWLAREFFPLHIKMYSKSRRKAPIYWQLATPSASYSVWLYIHAFTKDTLYKVQNEYVAPKLAHEERRLESLRRELGESPKAAERKALTVQETFVDELRAFLEEVKRVAPLWNPGLDDGVIINFAPLWRLVPHHKPWQKELKATWDALCGEQYDWAHLAMHLWPERVVPKCATDRSLAIAHGLEEVFWVEGAGGKWTARKTPTRPVEELVRERTSPAVKAALKSLLEAPVATGGSKKARKGKANA